MDKKREDPDRSRLGTVGKLADGRSYVRFERYLNHTVEEVWAALTEPQHLARWFPGIKLTPEEGGSFEIWFSEECEGPAHLSGTVSTYKPPGVLEMGSMRWELTPRDKGCMLVFTDILAFDNSRTRAEFTNSVLGGWHKYMDMLEYSFEGGEGDPRDEPEFDYSRVEVEGREQ